MDASDKKQSSSELAETVAKLLDSDKFSDVVIKLKDRVFPGHRVVLYARSDHWSSDSLAKTTTLNWEHMSTDIGMAILRWVYTYDVDLSFSDNFVLDLMKHAGEFKLSNLVKLCERKLIDGACFENCIRFYTISGEINALNLKNHCAGLIATHWDRFTSRDFKDMSAMLLYQVVKSNTEYPLHSAVKFHRPDLVEVYLAENKSEVAKIINDTDANGDLPLGIALAERQTAIASTLCKHKADVNAKDRHGWSLLQRAIQRGDTYSASFLIANNSDVFCLTPDTGDTCLHLACVHVTSTLVADGATEEGEDVGVTLNSSADMVQVGQALLDKGLDPSKKNSRGFTPMHVAVMADNGPLLDVLLAEKATDVNVKNEEGYPPLWYALRRKSDTEVAEKLVARGARCDVLCSASRDSLLQLVICERLEEATLFLLRDSAAINLNHMNEQGETALHLAAMFGLPRVVRALLDGGAHVNIETVRSTNKKPAGIGDPYTGYKQTCLHVAIVNEELTVVETLLKHPAAADCGETLDCNLKDSNGNTPLGLALLMNMKSVVPLLLDAGADINARDAEGRTSLHQAIAKADSETAIFLVHKGADINLLTRDNLTPLHLCIQHKLPEVVDSLCRRGVDLSVGNERGECPLWAALSSGQEDIASILVRNGVDTDAWGEGPEGCYQTLLHKAIDENNQPVAKFLIQSGCDLNAPRRPSPGGEGGDEARDGCTPLHLCCQWGLEDVVQTLLEHGASINKADAEEKTPLHVAIQNQHKNIIALLLYHPGLDLTLRDAAGLTPFATALMCRNNKAAQAILDRQPTAAEQFNNKGQNFLHMALQNNQVENVLFLLSIQVDVNSRVRDERKTTPLHLAAAGGNEVLVRSLILSGARLDQVDAYQQTPLHTACEKGNSAVALALLQNGARPDLADSDGSNPLHVACKEGHLATVRVLLTESPLDAELTNYKGHNPLHVLARYGKENAAVICNLFLETMPDYPLDRADPEGNTALLLAYMRGNGNLCRSLVKAGACLGCMNKEGVTLFNYQVPTKQLLYSLLDSLEKEPPWAEGSTCLECGTKFTFTMRAHHCRHCGRLLCGKCSEQDVPIIKYKLNKPVRVCAVCFDLLQVGAS